MFFKSDFILALLILSLAQSGLAAKKLADKLVTVQVYYESLCPDSIRFIKNQLTPTFQELGQYFDVEFVPYGKASFEKQPGQNYTFVCQHGPDECSGNKYQACLLSELKSNADQVAAVSCIMSSPEPDIATEECMEQLGFKKPSYQFVEACHKSIAGDILLANNGKKTMALDPQLYFVPWITFNGVWNKERFELSLRDLTKSLCDNEISKVPECKTRA